MYRILRIGLCCILFQACNCSNKDKAEMTQVSKTYEMRFIETYNKVYIGMKKSSVISIFNKEKIHIDSDPNTLYFGKDLRLWSHQSPIMPGRAKIVFSLDDKVMEKIIIEDYLGVKYQSGYIDSEEFFTNAQRDSTPKRAINTN